jgi:hypothetical protein
MNGARPVGAPLGLMMQINPNRAAWFGRDRLPRRTPGADPKRIDQPRSCGANSAARAARTKSRLNDRRKSRTLGFLPIARGAVYWSSASVRANRRRSANAAHQSAGGQAAVAHLTAPPARGRGEENRAHLFT